MEGEENTMTLPKGVPALVLQWLRVVGLAPVVNKSNRLHISRALTFYGRVLITAISSIGVFSIINEIKQSQQKVIKHVTTLIVMIFEYVIYISINMYVVYVASDGVKRWIKQMERISVVKTKLGDHISTDMIKRKELQLIALLVLELIFVISGFYVDYMGFRISTLFCTFVIHFTFWLSYLYTVIIQMWLILTSWHIASLFSSFNKTVKKITCALDDKGKSGYKKKGSMQNYQTIVSQLDTIYIEICELVTTRNSGGDGITMILIILKCTVCLMANAYLTLMMSFRKQPVPTWCIIVRVFSLLCHVININMTIAPGHFIIQENDDIRFVVGKLMGKTHVYSDELSKQLERLIVSLILNKPALSPLNLCTFSRRLFVSIVGIVVTYLVILVQYRLAE